MDNSTGKDQVCLGHRLLREAKPRIREHRGANGERRVERFSTADDEHRRQAVQRIGASLAYMMQHLDKPLRVSTLSARASLAPAQFTALFKRATGYAPIDYFIRARMQRACELFKTESLRVKEVAALMGYDDPFYFSRRFKCVIGVAPQAYRSRFAASEARDGINNHSLLDLRERSDLLPAAQHDRNATLDEHPRA